MARHRTQQGGRWRASPISVQQWWWLWWWRRRVAVAAASGVPCCRLVRKTAGAQRIHLLYATSAAVELTVKYGYLQQGGVAHTAIRDWDRQPIRLGSSTGCIPASHELDSEPFSLGGSTESRAKVNRLTRQPSKLVYHVQKHTLRDPPSPSGQSTDLCKSKRNEHIVFCIRSQLPARELCMLVHLRGIVHRCSQADINMYLTSLKDHVRHGNVC